MWLTHHCTMPELKFKQYISQRRQVEDTWNIEVNLDFLFLDQLHKAISSKSSFVFNQYTHVNSYRVNAAFKNSLPFWKDLWSNSTWNFLSAMQNDYMTSSIHHPKFFLKKHGWNLRAKLWTHRSDMTPLTSTRIYILKAFYGKTDNQIYYL